MAALRFSEFSDDPELSGESCLLLRRIRKMDLGVSSDGSGTRKVASSAFQLQKLDKSLELGYPGRCMSLALRDLVDGKNIVDFIIDEETYVIGQVPASVFKAEGYGLQRDPKDGEPWHVIAFANEISDSQSDIRRKKIAMACSLITVAELIQGD